MAELEPEDTVPAPEEESEVLPTYTWEEIMQHKSAQSLWLVIHNKVYDMTKFMEEHPGGEEVLLEQGGRDGTEAFEDVGHSPDAREIQETYLIGQLDPASRKPSVPIKTAPTPPEVDSSSNWLVAVGVLGVAVAIVAVVYRVYFSA